MSRRVTDNREHTEALDLDALRKLCDEATSGPWEVRIDRYDPVVVGAGSNWPHGDDDAYATAYRLADAKFLAAARSAVPALIAEVDRLRRQISELADDLASTSKLDGTLHPAALSAYFSAARRVRALGDRPKAEVPR